MQPHRDGDPGLGRILTHDPQRGSVYLPCRHGRQGGESQLYRQTAVCRERGRNDILRQLIGVRGRRVVGAPAVGIHHDLIHRRMPP